MKRPGPGEPESAGVDPTLRRADVRDLPYEDSTFDLVMSAHVLEHLANPAIAVAEMLRVLKPGATLLLIVTRWGLLGFAVHLLWRVYGIREKDVARWLRGQGAHEVRVRSLGGPPWCRHMSLACTARNRLSERDER